MQKVLVIAAHPDDQILGGGATFWKHVLSGDEIHCLILGEGMTSRQGKDDDLIFFGECTKKANEIIGFKETYWHKLPDNKFDSIPLLDITQTVEVFMKTIEPDIVYTHHFGDLNIDHKLTFQAVMTACRPGCSTAREIYCFETPSSTEWAFDGNFKPNVFVEVDEIELGRKFGALKCYGTEIREFPHPRSIRGLRARAEYWGQVAGVEYAEAFELVRKVE